ncbi:MAG: hypothetical protein J6Y37_11350 [Paludibacteraceae bacterium]|nr:hypothetical protein [Paludibacteraceae bacterium]
MVFKKGLYVVMALCGAFAVVGCDDEDEETPIKKTPFQTLTQVSLPDVSCDVKYSMGDTMVSAQFKKGKDVINLTFGYDPYTVEEKATIDYENYVRNYQDVETKKGKIVKMVSVVGEKSDSILYTYEGDHIVSAKIASWVDDTTKLRVQKTYQWDGDKLTKLTLHSQKFINDSVGTPKLDEYTFSYQMPGGPVIHWQFIFPILMDVDFSWAGYADLFFSMKSNGVPHYCKAVHYPNANDLTLSKRETYSITSTNKTDNVTFVVACQEGSGTYWQKECKLTY